VRLLLVLGALSAFGPWCVDMYLPALPAITGNLGTGAAQVQLTLTSCVVGLALGQLVVGPLSDALGRRRPLLCGIALYTAAAAACALAPTVTALVGLRFLQGLGAATGVVIARAVVRDRYTGVAAAHYFSAMMQINGIAPIVAPILGGQLLRWTSWRGLFLALTLLGVALLAATHRTLPETLRPDRRRRGGPADTAQAFRTLLTDREFLGYALSGGLVFSAMFAYISGSSFVLQAHFHLTPQAYSAVFAANALGIVAAGQVSTRLVGRVPPRRLLAAGLLLAALGGLALLVAALAGAGLAGILPPLFLLVSSVGLVGPNATALALAAHPNAAGTASALVGTLQFVLGGVTAPLVGLGGTTSPTPMAAVIAALAVLGALACATLTGRTHAPAEPLARVGQS
jgi:DHA1 family bicyclomycin/chloramphenicol resistance-like MFS transporter